MSIVKMNKISVIGLDYEKEQIIDSLMKMGVVEIIDIGQNNMSEELERLVIPDGDEDAVATFENEISRIKTAIDYLSKYNTKKKKLFEPKRVVGPDLLNRIINNQDRLWNVVRQLDEYEEKLSGLKAEENRHLNLIASIEPWRLLTIPVDIVSTKSTTVLFATVPAAVDTGEIEQNLYEQAPESYLEVVNRDNDQSYLLLIYHKSVEETVSGIMKQYGFNTVHFKGLNGTVEENIKRSSKIIDDIEKQKKEIDKSISALADEMDDLQVLYDYLAIERDKKQVLSRLVKTDKVFMLEGWLPRDESEKVKNHILKHWDVVVEIREPEKDEQYPILLKNNRFVKPFELVTELFSLPNSNEIDPNAFMAPFFFFFFGLMVGDAGYGLLMVLGTGIILRKFKFEGTIDKLIKLLFYCGISTFAWGALLGGWFGDVVSAVTGGAYTIKPIWFNPLEDPMKLLIWSFVFGVIHLFTGMGINAYKQIREGKIVDAIFDTGFWYIFLIGLMLLLAGGTFAVIGKYMAIIGAVLLVLTQGRSEKNIFKKFTKGLLSLYNSVGFFSDVLSYSRLLALGLSTGVVASVINTIGTLFGFGPFGIVVFIVAFVVGSLFNMLINVLGAYVHSSRLQYVEFFGKFYEGGGKAFEPFKIKTKYTNLDDRRIE